MKRLRRVTASNEIKNVFTPSEVVDLLMAIDELSTLKVSYKEFADGRVAFTIGDNVYEREVETVYTA